MKCKYCKKEIPEGSKVCSHRGCSELQDSVEKLLTGKQKIVIAARDSQGEKTWIPEVIKALKDPKYKFAVTWKDHLSDWNGALELLENRGDLPIEYYNLKEDKTNEIYHITYHGIIADYAIETDYSQKMDEWVSVSKKEGKDIARLKSDFSEYLLDGKNPKPAKIVLLFEKFEKVTDDSYISFADLKKAKLGKQPSRTNAIILLE